MNWDALIFDLDGTLWDCCAACAEGFNRAYELCGLPQRVTADFVRSISGKVSTECEAILLAGVADSVRDTLSPLFESCELSAVRASAANAIYPGTVEGLAALREKYSLFLVSNCGTAYLETFLSLTPLGPYFSDSECFGRTRRSKPENICAVIGRNGISSACYIGDTSGDESAAAAAAVDFIHAAYGFGKPFGVPPAFRSFPALTEFLMQKNRPKILKKLNR